MRRLIPAVALVLTAAFAVAQEPAREKPDQAAKAEGQKEMTAIVVSADPTVKTITVKNETAAPGAEPKTLPVAGSAVAHLSSIKAGEKVKLVLTTDARTKQESVTSIKKAEASAR